MRDLLEGRERHLCEVSWHFAPDLVLHEKGGACVAAPAGRAESGNTKLALVPAQGSGWNCALAWDEVSPAYGTKEAAPVVRISGRVQLPAEFAAAIVPLLAPRDLPGSLAQIAGAAADATGVCGYRYDQPEGSQSMIFSNGRGAWKLGPWTSDADFLYCSVRDGEVTHFILCNGSFAQLAGTPVFSRSGKIERFEWRDSGKGAQMFASEDIAPRSFSQDGFRSHDFAF